MKCPNCYNEIEEGCTFCPHCGAQQQPTYSSSTPENGQETQAQSEPAGQEDIFQTYSQTYSSQQTQTPPPSYQSDSIYEEPTVSATPYIVLSILCSIFCCIWIGIPALLYAGKIWGAVSAGDNEAAKKAAKTAKIWIIVTAVVGVLWILFVAIGIVGGSLSILDYANSDPGLYY